MRDHGLMSRTLHGGPMDGAHVDAPEGMTVEIAVPCPWGGDHFHLAAAEYDHEGRYMETVCRRTDGDPLHTR